MENMFDTTRPVPGKSPHPESTGPAPSPAEHSSGGFITEVSGAGSKAGGSLSAGSLSIPGDTLWYLLEEGALLYLGFIPPDAPQARIPAALQTRLDPLTFSSLPPAKTESVERELTEYFAGRRQRFSLPLRLTGTPFQRKIWEELLTVPFGRTVTYGELAAAAGRPGASRAAGSAVGSNPISVVVPCHRVLPAAGGVGNYGGGSARKRRLLELEGAAVSES